MTGEGGTGALAEALEAEPPSASEADDWAERAADQRAGDLGPTVEPEPEAPKALPRLREDA